METRLPKDFLEFLSLLNNHKVEHLVIGGYAVGYHGYPRATGDIDIWIKRSNETAEKMVQVFLECGVSDIDKSLFLKEKGIVRMGLPPNRSHHSHRWGRIRAVLLESGDSKGRRLGNSNHQFD